MSENTAVVISVTTHYLPAHSAPEANQYQFAYTITLENQSHQPVQLLERYWLITDGNEKVIEVEGEGVIGKQPHLNVGERFQYTSGAMLETPVGTMQGHYLMRNEDGSEFKAPIPIFLLAVDGALH
ncbi:Co2+/Mg2+ efflux protein ApaG [Rosenbergiella australiborealis]|uniref:Protein ApaG n=1 Tax=Rosenbergiella australiborealis TaxID=1544696 RepID=A0ABS5T1D3_9GAMM|nr:Co2+/Mg2+ efflux protein ApaG [Rosenbergiella australiborealis]MBT0726149.1 Co2+/Mg2+ efflux protein ApaG [Rosenbergiella australiborealis]